MSSKQTVFSLWVGDALPPEAVLCIKSFLDHGHSFELYSYGPVKGIPAGTILKDAGSVLPKGAIFKDSAHRSYALFADWWRMKKLHRDGGFWVDMDVVCVSDRLPEVRPWYASQGDGLVAVGALAFEPGHQLPGMLAEAAEDPSRPFPWDPESELQAKAILKSVKADATQRRVCTPWGFCGPNEFTNGLKHLGLYTQAAHSSTIYPVHYTMYKLLFDGKLRLDDPTFRYCWGIHLWGDYLRRNPAIWENMTDDSVVAALCRRHGLSK